MTHEAHFETYQRDDDTFGWRLRGRNGEIVAVDGGQGFRDRHDAMRGIDAMMVIIDNRGEYLRVDHE